MKKLCSLLVCAIAVVVLCNFGQVNTAYGYPKFLKAFQQKYVGDKKAGQTEEQQALAAEMKRVKTCNVCHDPRPDESGKPQKKNRNPYGELLNKHLTEKDKNDLEKAVEMLGKIEGEKQDKDAEKTFGELIKAGKVPFEYKDFKPGDEEEDEDASN
jgi:hypothetical protein